MHCICCGVASRARARWFASLTHSEASRRARARGAMLWRHCMQIPIEEFEIEGYIYLNMYVAFNLYGIHYKYTGSVTQF